MKRSSLMVLIVITMVLALVWLARPESVTAQAPVRVYKVDMTTGVAQSGGGAVVGFSCTSSAGGNVQCFVATRP